MVFTNKEEFDIEIDKIIYLTINSKTKKNEYTENFLEYIFSIKDNNLKTELILSDKFKELILFINHNIFLKDSFKISTIENIFNNLNMKKIDNINDIKKIVNLIETSANINLNKNSFFNNLKYIFENVRKEIENIFNNLNITDVKEEEILKKIHRMINITEDLYDFERRINKELYFNNRELSLSFYQTITNHKLAFLSNYCLNENNSDIKIKKYESMINKIIEIEESIVANKEFSNQLDFKLLLFKNSGTIFNNNNNPPIFHANKILSEELYLKIINILNIKREYFKSIFDQQILSDELKETIKEIQTLERDIFLSYIKNFNEKVFNELCNDFDVEENYIPIKLDNDIIKHILSNKFILNSNIETNKKIFNLIENKTTNQEDYTNNSFVYFKNYFPVQQIKGYLKIEDKIENYLLDNISKFKGALDFDIIKILQTQNIIQKDNIFALFLKQQFDFEDIIIIKNFINNIIEEDFFITKEETLINFYTVTFNNQKLYDILYKENEYTKTPIIDTIKMRDNLFNLLKKFYDYTLNYTIDSQDRLDIEENKIQFTNNLVENLGINKNTFDEGYIRNLIEITEECLILLNLSLKRNTTLISHQLNIPFPEIVIKSSFENKYEFNNNFVENTHIGKILTNYQLQNLNDDLSKLLNKKRNDLSDNFNKRELLGMDFYDIKKEYQFKEKLTTSILKDKSNKLNFNFQF